MKRLPLPAKQAFVEVLGGCHDLVAWSCQMFIVMVNLIPKASGGERAIGIIEWLARLWAHSEDECLDGWADPVHGPWDAAVRGSSALMEASRRAF